jgi:hypothetical protein
VTPPEGASTSVGVVVVVVSSEPVDGVVVVD